MTELSDVLKKATLPTRRVALCVAGELAGELLDLQYELEQLAEPTSLAGTGRAEVEAKIADVREQMRESNVEFELRALNSRAWNKLWLTLPTRIEGETDDAWADRSFPFYAELIARTVVDPKMDASGVTELAEAIHQAAWTALINECLMVNRAKVDIPNSAAASR